MLVFVVASILGLLILAPNLWQMADPRYRGIPVHLNTDEHAYLQHLQETLLGRFGEGGKGIVESLVGEPGLVLVPIEELYGLLFGWTGMSAAQVFVLLDFVLPFVICLAVYWFCRLLGLSKKMALLATVIICLLQIYNLGRPVQQRTSFLLTVLTLGAFQHVLSGHKRALLWSGIGLGLMMATYLWGWMTLWAVWGVLLLQMLSRGWQAAKPMARLGLLGLTFALPSIWRMVSISHHPLYEEVMSRSGARTWYLPESWPWTICTALMMLGCLYVWYKRGKKPAEALFVAMPMAGFAVFNQQMIHGIEILFRNHVLIYMALASVLSGLYLWQNRRLGWLSRLGLLGAILMVGASASEARYYPRQWIRSDEKYQEQHLAAVLPVLDALPVATILSDPQTSLFLVSHSKHYTVYTRYLFQSGFLGNAELAQRYCASVLGYPAAQWARPHIFNGTIQLDLALRQQIIEQESEVLQQACADVQQRASSLLKEFGVQYILLDTKRLPERELEWMRVEAELVERGEGWELWQIGE